jgi:putative ABC transport system substrate-binding protein
VKRRRLLALAGALPVAARAQSIKSVGFLVAADPEPGWTLFKKAMAAAGYVEGRSVSYEFRSGGTDEARLAGLAGDLVRLKVDVIVAVLTPAVVAARKATTTIPIVFVVANPELAGVNNIARPEGNATGVFSPSSATAGKTVQLFHEIKPAATTLGVLLNAQDPFRVPLLQGIEPAAKAAQLQLVTKYVGAQDRLEAEVAAMAERKVGGLFVQPSLGLKELAQLGLKYRLPTISFRREFVEAGGLLSCGANVAANFRLVADYVDKILKGAAPGSLPVQQAVLTETVANQTTARALGITLPALFLARVDEVIE